MSWLRNILKGSFTFFFKPLGCNRTPLDPFLGGTKCSKISNGDEQTPRNEAPRTKYRSSGMYTSKKLLYFILQIVYFRPFYIVMLVSCFTFIVANDGQLRITLIK